MNTTRIWVVATVVLSIGLLLGGWFLGVQPKLVEAGTAELQRVDAVALNVVNEQTLAELKEQFESLDIIEAELTEVQKAMPYRLDAPAVLAELYALASTTSVVVSEIKIDEPRAYGTPAPVAAPVAETTAEGESTETTEEVPVEPAAATTPVAPPSVTDPRITPANFVAVPMSVSVLGTYTTAQSYVRALQSGERLFLVTGLTLNPVDSAAIGPDALFTGVITGYVYVLLDPVAEEADAEAALAADEAAGD